METKLSRTVALAAYHLTLLVGIALFPLAVLANKLGLRLPVHRILARFDGVDEDAEER